MLKGKAIVGQSGGSTAVINQSVAGVIAACRSQKKISHLWGAQHGATGILEGNFLDLLRQPKSLVDQIANLPASALGTTRQKLKPGEEKSVIKRFKKWNVRYLFLVGGNDTAQTIHRIAQAAREQDYDLHAIHIPKTIDNDLVETDHCPGYGSVARFVAQTTQEAGLDTKSARLTDPVKIVEVMGRNSGWIVASSALLKDSAEAPPHLMLIPEIPFEQSWFLKQVERSLTKVGHCIVVMSETVRDKQGKLLGERLEGITKDAFGHNYTDGAAQHLAHLVERRLKVRARFDKPGTIQRMAMPYVSKVDQAEAFQAGVHAVRWAVKGTRDVMVGFRRLKQAKYKISYVPVPLEKIPDQERDLPKSFFNPTTHKITESFRKYALPLLGDKLPSFPTFKKVKVKL